MKWHVVIIFFCKDIHKELEKKISQFHEREDTILYISCFDANAGIFETLLTPEDYVLSDELNHASIIDGIRLSKARKMRYKHRDMKGRYVQIVLYFYFWKNKGQMQMVKIVLQKRCFEKLSNKAFMVCLQLYSQMKLSTELSIEGWDFSPALFQIISGRLLREENRPEEKESYLSSKGCEGYF